MLINNRVIAHRGASAYAPENTFSAFNKALALGSNCLEFDVMLSADNVAFVFHDENLGRTTNGRGEFGKTKADYLHSLDAGSWFKKQFKNEQIPLFSEVLQWLLFAGITANIEIKPYPGTAEKTTVEVLRQLNQYWPRNRPLPLISSFDYSVLSLCQSLAPEQPLGLLLDNWDLDWLSKARHLNCYSIHFNKKALTADRTRAVKEENFSLFVYTVNRRRQALKLLSWGVDAVFSDYPDLL